jgi:hypothetical protein
VIAEFVYRFARNMPSADKGWTMTPMNMWWMKACVSDADFAPVPARAGFGIWWKIPRWIDCRARH